MLRTAIGSGSHRFVGILLVTLTLTACGGDGGSSTAQSTAPPMSTPITAPPSKNAAPVIQGTAAPAVTVGQDYSFQPTAHDADQDKLTFTIANKPAWASFDADTGKLS